MQQHVRSRLFIYLQKESTTFTLRAKIIYTFINPFNLQKHPNRQNNHHVVCLSYLNYSGF
jgi:hypothetical protein